LLKTLQDFCTVFGSERPISVSRELSKLHQETLRGSAAQMLEHFQNQAPRGEFVIVLSGMDKKSIKAKITQSGPND